MAGLIGALIAALLLIVAIWGLTRFQDRDVASPAPAVDFAAELATAREQAPFPVLAPRPVPDGWRATSVSWDGAGPEVAWHLGFVTGAGSDAAYVGVEQGNAPAAEFVAAHTPADLPADPVDIGGARWQALTSDGDETALYRTAADGATTLVTGTLPEAELVAFVESLSPR